MQVLSDTSMLLSYYEALLCLFEQLCRTKVGATHVLNAGLFQAMRGSQLFAVDPDIGLGLILSSSYVSEPN